MAWARRLLQPLDYLWVEHREKRAYDVWIPLALTLPAASFLAFAPGRPNVFAEFGLVHGVNGLLQILTGFYIASLAAIATFNKEGMDEVMPGEVPILDTESGRTEKLTRRRFLCLMFGYMAFLSLALYLLGIGTMATVESIKRIVPVAWYGPMRIGFVYIYCFVLANLVTTTLLGLFYMADRIHRHEPKLLTGSTPPTKDE